MCYPKGRILGGNPAALASFALVAGWRATFFQASWEGEATMSLLPPGSKRVLPILILLAIITLLAIPVTWTARAPWNAIGPSLAWAGSPDETLSPPPVPPPPGKKAAKAVAPSDGARALPTTSFSKMDALSRALSTRSFLSILWRVSLATTMRY